MKQPQAFGLALLLLIAATAVSRRYLSRNAQILLAVVAAGAHLA